MAQKIKVPFKEKEGKFFAPIIGTVDIVNGVKKANPVPKAGVKGSYAKVWLELPMDQAMTKHELFAVSTETFLSSK